MRRALATLLMMSVSFPLIAAVMLLGDASLPECCRRAGQHHCMMSSGDLSPSGEPGLRASGERCGSFPKAVLAMGATELAILRSSAKVFAEIVSHPAIQIQTEARRRVSFARSSQKRGPPAFLS